MFQRILVSLDGSSRDEHALAMATHLAHTTQGSLVLMRVVSTATEFWPALTAQSPLIGPIVRAHLREAREYLNELTLKPMFDDLLTETVVRFGPVVPTILSTTSAYDIDTLLLCRHKSIDPLYIIHDSATTRIIRYTRVPTIVLNEADTSAIYYHPVEQRSYSALVALTGSAHTEKNTIQTTAHLLANLFPPKQGKLHLTIVTNAEDIQQRDQRLQPPEQTERHEKKGIEELQDTWVETLHPEPSVETTFSVVVENNVPQTVAQIAAKRADEGDEQHKYNFIAFSAQANKEPTPSMQDSNIEYILQSTQRPLLVIPIG